MRTLLILGLTLCFAGSASAFTLIDFDDVAAGTPVGYDFGGYGVDFYNDTTDTLTVDEQYPGPPFSSPNAVIDYNGYSGSTNYGVFLNLPANYVTVVMGDLGGSEFEELWLEAYDSGDNLVDSDSYVLPDNEPGYMLEVSAGEIAYVKFYSLGDYPGSVYFDNFGFEPVPEPATVSLVGFGVLGLAGLLKRRF